MFSSSVSVPESLHAKPRFLTLPQRCPRAARAAGRPAGALAQAPAVEQGHGPSSQALIDQGKHPARCRYVQLIYGDLWWLMVIYIVFLVIFGVLW